MQMKMRRKSCTHGPSGSQVKSQQIQTYLQASVRQNHSDAGAETSSHGDYEIGVLITARLARLPLPVLEGIFKADMYLLFTGLLKSYRGSHNKKRCVAD